MIHWLHLSRGASWEWSSFPLHKELRLRRNISGWCGHPDFFQLLRWPVRSCEELKIAIKSIKNRYVSLKLFVPRHHIHGCLPGCSSRKRDGVTLDAFNLELELNKLLSTIYLLEILVLVLKCYYNLSHKSKNILQCSCAAQTKLL